MCGYRWQTDDAASSVLPAEPTEFLLESDAVGGGGRRRLRFSCAGRGRLHVALRLERPWDGESTIDEFRVTFNVE